ncbi:MAG TPA: hypothetical protein VD978_11150 [Azospirillum sp.]|nr:hypothetical protein [Azospirillum sp.]
MTEGGPLRHERKPPSIPDQLLDQRRAGADPKSAFAKDGLLDELKKALAERALNAEIDYLLEGDVPDHSTFPRSVAGRVHPHPIAAQTQPAP